jgi:hypothetical protein
VGGGAGLGSNRLQGNTLGQWPRESCEGLSSGLMRGSIVKLVLLLSCLVLYYDDELDRLGCFCGPPAYSYDEPLCSAACGFGLTGLCSLTACLVASEAAIHVSPPLLFASLFGAAVSTS